MNVKTYLIARYEYWEHLTGRLNSLQTTKMTLHYVGQKLLIEKELENAFPNHLIGAASQYTCLVKEVREKFGIEQRPFSGQLSEMGVSEHSLLFSQHQKKQLRLF